MSEFGVGRWGPVLVALALAVGILLGLATADWGWVAR